MTDLWNWNGWSENIGLFVSSFLLVKKSSFHEHSTKPKGIVKYQYTETHGPMLQKNGIINGRQIHWGKDGPSL